MRLILKLTAALLFVAIIACAVSFFTEKSSYGNWTIQAKTKDTISWINFYWTGDTLGGKWYERTAMMIAAKIDGVTNPVSFQFDLGDPYTELYSYNVNAVATKYTALTAYIGRLHSPLQFWSRQRSLKNFMLRFSTSNISAKDVLIRENYGDNIFIHSVKDTLPIGTLGADVFQNKILIIDYPARRFAICDSVPLRYKTAFAPFESDKSQKIILPMNLKGHHYRITFDNGSSLFSLITLAKNITNFSSLPDTDSMEITSWGQRHTVTGRPLKDSFSLAGHRFGNVMIYSNHSGLGIDLTTDGMAGNALFWNHVVIIDFKNKQFGIK